MQRWQYIFSYRAHFGPDNSAEMSGSVGSDNELSELDLHELVLLHLPGHEDMPDGLRPEDFVITRFSYVSWETDLAPDIEQDGQGAVPADNPAPDQPGQV